jgi:hypothetical protein
VTTEAATLLQDAQNSDIQILENPVRTGFSRVPTARWRETRSLDLGFLVHHVLANDRIVLLEFKLVRSVTLVLVGGVEVASTGT